MLHEAGYATRRDPKELIVADPRNDVEFFYLRPRDIATYVGSGALDVGITGRDLLLDSHSAAVEVDELDFGASTFRFAGPAGRFTELKDLAGVRVATSYDGLVGDFLEREGVDGRPWCAWMGRSSPRSGSGSRMRSPTSSRPAPRSRSRASRSSAPSSWSRRRVLIASKPGRAGARDAAPPHPGRHGRPPVRAHGLRPARRTSSTRRRRSRPGLESPTVSPLRDSDWVAVRVMVPRVETHHLMDELYALGARAILVSAIHAARI